MQVYDLDLNAPAKPPQKKGMGCALGGWFLFALVLVGTLYMVQRTWFFYNQIRSGGIVDLPQYDALLSVADPTARRGADQVDRKMLEIEGSPAFGPEKDQAELVIVEFADFQCPYSKDESAVVRRLMQKYGDRVRFEYRDYPLDDIHHDATQAALAGRCAQEQGRFWPFHDKLFASSPALSLNEMTVLATEVGMDPRQFERCVLDSRYRDDVDTDRTTAQNLGLRGTPTFFLNGRRIDGAIPEDVFEDVIEKMLK